LSLKREIEVNHAIEKGNFQNFISEGRQIAIIENIANYLNNNTKILLMFDKKNLGTKENS